MRTGVIIGSAVAGAVAGAIISMTAEDRRNAENYLSGLWDRVPSNVQGLIPKNLKGLRAEDLKSAGRGTFKTVARKTKRFANAGRVGDVNLKSTRGKGAKRK